MPLLPVPLLAGLLMAAPVSEPCPAPAAAPGTFVVATLTSRQDSTIRLTVCLATPAGRRVGSYHGEISYPPATLQVLAVDTPRDGLRVDNSHVPGRVAFAGAMPNGVGSSELLTVTLRASGHADITDARLRIVELNDASGADVLPATHVDSMIGGSEHTEDATVACGRRPHTGRPVLERLVPATLTASMRSADLEIMGCGFDSVNVVIVGASRFTGVVSTSGGTRLHLTVPLADAGGGEVSPMPARPGTRTVVVSTSRGRSNALPLVVQ